MKVLVDTSVWSLALRRSRAGPDPIVEELRHLIDEGRVAIVGPIRQELLSGVRTPEGFAELREHLQAFADEALVTADFERAAEHFNTCRGRGIQGSNVDFLLCAAAERRGLAIFTTNRDFTRFARILPITLHGRSTP